MRRIGILGLLGAGLAGLMPGLAAMGRPRRGPAPRQFGHFNKGRRSIAQGNRNVRNIRSGAPAPHLHIRERARRLYRPGPERRAFIARERAANA